ncbi:hypothetical protein K2173_014968 [Erythroxylum novogranatense]|uniref:Uncharacterized protein n=1 Tax=Erythroxylum novogranatense TaxID=1862640 RepID=A0AAV8S6S0_9ROSI|nr:hypothetical protein K2173_014968 [Erythroxylum novogranatense]
MEHLRYAKVCIEVLKQSPLPDTLPILQLTELGELEKSVISIPYPWKPCMVSKTWKPTDASRVEVEAGEIVVEDEDQLAATNRKMVAASPVLAVTDVANNVSTTSVQQDANTPSVISDTIDTDCRKSTPMVGLENCDMVTKFLNPSMVSPSTAPGNLVIDLAHYVLEAQPSANTVCEENRAIISIVELVL